MNKEILMSKKWYLVLSVIVVLAVLSGVFSLGVSVGFHKAGFNGRLGERYERNFEGGRRGPGMMGGFGMGRGLMFDRNLPSAYTTAGEILDLNANGLTVIDNDGVEKNVSVTDKTIIRKYRDDIKFAELKTGDAVVVMGAPDNQGRIEARLVRVMPGLNQGQLPGEQLIRSAASSSAPNASTTKK